MQIAANDDSSSMTMRVTLEIKPETIANVMISAIESGYLNYWCGGIELVRGKEFADKDHWYAGGNLYANAFSLRIIELAEDKDGARALRHRKTQQDFCRAYLLMAQNFPHRFAELLSDETDAEFADLFLQLVTFGELKYA